MILLLSVRDVGILLSADALDTPPEIVRAALDDPGGAATRNSIHTRKGASLVYTEAFGVTPNWMVLSYTDGREDLIDVARVVTQGRANG